MQGVVRFIYNTAAQIKRAEQKSERTDVVDKDTLKRESVY
jgi:hypothetical protein